MKILKHKMMKKLWLATIMMVGISTIAQDNKMNDHRGRMNDFTPEQLAALQTKKMTLALDLNDSQQSKLKTLLTEDANMRKKRMEAMKTKKESGKKMSTEEKYTHKNEKLDYEIARKKEMKALLTADQYAKWEKMKQHKKRVKRGHGDDHGTGRRSEKR